MAEDRFAPHAIAGMAMAAFELQRQQILLLYANGLATKQQLLDMIDLALQQVERYQMTGNAYLEAPAQAARLHMSGLQLQCQRLRE